VAPLLQQLQRILPLLLWAVLAAGAEEAPPHITVSPDDIRITRAGDGFRIDVTLVVAAPLEVAWQVLTDFDHMARFIPNLERSAVVRRKGHSLLIEQQGKVYFGPFSVEFGSTREVDLVPMRTIRAHQISGTTRSMDSSMQLQSVAEGTRLEYHAELVPETYLPPMFGPGVVRREMADQFTAILNEMRMRTSSRKG
jgi:carbon monoxide dehydrogenase subunit G